jgi:hypothetical protein
VRCGATSGRLRTRAARRARFVDLVGEHGWGD